MPGKAGWSGCKLLSYTVIISVMFSFAGVRIDGRIAAFAVLGVALAHSILIYQQHRFGLIYLFPIA
jgi:hypothetical protein